MKPRYSNGRFHKDLRYLYPLYWILVTTVGLQLGLGIPSGATNELFFGTHTAKAQVGEVLNDAAGGYSLTTSISPTPAPQLVIVATPLPEQEMDDMSAYISQAVNEFLPTHKSEALMIMHCLAHREAGHGASNAHGDNGKAGGPFQFWNETWNRMRGQMIAQGVANEIGSRYDKLESARTTAWALANGRALEWGPILRKSQGSDYAVCQVPSWHK